jgi:hypothetical protein
MIMKISNKINILCDSKKLLVLGTLDSQYQNILDTYFSNKELMQINKSSIEIINESYFEQFDLIIITFDLNSFNLFFEMKLTLPKDAMVIIPKELYLQFQSHINTISSFLVGDFSQELFLDKLYNTLAIKETNQLISSKEKIINKYKNDSINTDINEFLDKYSGSIMFINEDLNEQLEKLKELEISKEIFKNIATNMIQFANILKHNEHLEHLAGVFSEFSEFLKALDLESIEPSRYGAFDYLTTIVEDITIYIDELFVYRLFKDVRVFEDSLENNIGYFEAALFGMEESEDEENLEFF